MIVVSSFSVFVTDNDFNEPPRMLYVVVTSPIVLDVRMPSSL